MFNTQANTQAYIIQTASSKEEDLYGDCSFLHSREERGIVVDLMLRLTYLHCKFGLKELEQGFGTRPRPLGSSAALVIRMGGCGIA